MTLAEGNRRPMPALGELKVRQLGRAAYLSPFAAKHYNFANESARVLLASTSPSLPAQGVSRNSVPSFEIGGPRTRLFFNPAKINCAIVSCGGLCPGLNDVIRSIVLTLTHHYGVRRVIGFRYGFAGMTRHPAAEPMALNAETVDGIHDAGGTILGTSRGPQNAGEMVDSLERHKISILFALGGDGTLRGASAIAKESLRRKRPISVIGIPKTIDNDIQWVERSFGFTTAVDLADSVLRGAHMEAQGAWNGVGLVKLMGRDSGFIAANASLSSAEVNFCLVPEVPFTLEGARGFLPALERRLDRKHHALVVVSEAAGKHLLRDKNLVTHDESGNIRYPDIGPYLRDQIRAYFKVKRKPVDVKYIDPSYTIRAVPANALDSEFCSSLGQHAVHAGMAGRTDMMVGFWNQNYTHVPIALATHGRKTIDPQGELWQRVLETTGQPHVRA